MNVNLDELIDRLGNPAYLDRMSKSRKDWYGFLHYYKQFHQAYQEQLNTNEITEESERDVESGGVSDDEGEPGSETDGTSEGAGGTSESGGELGES